MLLVVLVILLAISVGHLRAPEETEVSPAGLSNEAPHDMPLPIPFVEDHSEHPLVEDIEGVLHHLEWRFNGCDARGSKPAPRHQPAPYEASHAGFTHKLIARFKSIFKFEKHLVANDHCVGTFAKDVRISDDLFELCLNPRLICLQIRLSDFPTNGCIVLEVTSADGRSQETPFLLVRSFPPSHISVGTITTPATKLFFRSCRLKKATFKMSARTNPTSAVSLRFHIFTLSRIQRTFKEGWENMGGLPPRFFQNDQRKLKFRKLKLNNSS